VPDEAVNIMSVCVLDTERERERERNRGVTDTGKWFRGGKRRQVCLSVSLH
jgi:hypothetical protein